MKSPLVSASPPGRRDCVPGLHVYCLPMSSSLPEASLQLTSYFSENISVGSVVEAGSNLPKLRATGPLRLSLG